MNNHPTFFYFDVPVSMPFSFLFGKYGVKYGYSDILATPSTAFTFKSCHKYQLAEKYIMVSVFIPIMKNRRVMISDKAHTYLCLIRIYYYPDLSFQQMVDKIIDEFEMTYELKQKLLEA